MGRRTGIAVRWARVNVLGGAGAGDESGSQAGVELAGEESRRRGG